MKNILAKLIIWGYDLYLLFCLYKIKKTSKLSTYLAKISLGLEIETSGLHTLSIPHSWRNATWNKMLLLRYLRKILIDILFLATQMLFLVKSRFTRAYKSRKYLFFSTLCTCWAPALILFVKSRINLQCNWVLVFRGRAIAEKD